MLLNFPLVEILNHKELLSLNSFREGLFSKEALHVSYHPPIDLKQGLNKELELFINNFDRNNLNSLYILSCLLDQTNEDFILKELEKIPISGLNQEAKNFYELCLYASILDHSSFANLLEVQKPSKATIQLAVNFSFEKIINNLLATRPNEIQLKESGLLEFYDCLNVESLTNELDYSFKTKILFLQTSLLIGNQSAERELLDLLKDGSPWTSIDSGEYFDLQLLKIEANLTLAYHYERKFNEDISETLVESFVLHIGAALEVAKSLGDYLDHDSLVGVKDRYIINLEAVINHSLNYLLRFEIDQYEEDYTSYDPNEDNFGEEEEEEEEGLFQTNLGSSNNQDSNDTLQAIEEDYASLIFDKVNLTANLIKLFNASLDCYSKAIEQDLTPQREQCEMIYKLYSYYAKYIEDNNLADFLNDLRHFLEVDCEIFKKLSLSPSKQLLELLNICIESIVGYFNHCDEVGLFASDTSNKIFDKLENIIKIEQKFISYLYVNDPLCARHVANLGQMYLYLDNVTGGFLVAEDINDIAVSSGLSNSELANAQLSSLLIYRQILARISNAKDEYLDSQTNLFRLLEANDLINIFTEYGFQVDVKSNTDYLFKSLNEVEILLTGRCLDLYKKVARYCREESIETNSFFNDLDPIGFALEKKMLKSIKDLSQPSLELYINLSLEGSCLEPLILEELITKTSEASMRQMLANIDKSFLSENLGRVGELLLARKFFRILFEDIEDISSEYNLTKSQLEKARIHALYLLNKKAELDFKNNNFSKLKNLADRIYCFLEIGDFSNINNQIEVYYYVARIYSLAKMSEREGVLNQFILKSDFSLLSRRGKVIYIDTLVRNEILQSEIHKDDESAYMKRLEKMLNSFNQHFQVFCLKHSDLNKNTNSDRDIRLLLQTYMLILEVADQPNSQTNSEHYELEQLEIQRLSLFNQFLSLSEAFGEGYQVISKLAYANFNLQRNIRSLALKEVLESVKLGANIFPNTSKFEIFEELLFKFFHNFDNLIENETIPEVLAKKYIQILQLSTDLYESGGVVSSSNILSQKLSLKCSIFKAKYNYFDLSEAMDEANLFFTEVQRSPSLSISNRAFLTIDYVDFTINLIGEFDNIEYNLKSENTTLSDKNLSLLGAVFKNLDSSRDDLLMIIDAYKESKLDLCLDLLKRLERQCKKHQQEMINGKDILTMIYSRLAYIYERLGDEERSSIYSQKMME